MLSILFSIIFLFFSIPGYSENYIYLYKHYKDLEIKKRLLIKILKEEEVPLSFIRKELFSNKNPLCIKKIILKHLVKNKKNLAYKLLVREYLLENGENFEILGISSDIFTKKEIYDIIRSEPKTICFINNKQLPTKFFLDSFFNTNSFEVKACILKRLSKRKLNPKELQKLSSYISTHKKLLPFGLWIFFRLIKNFSDFIYIVQAIETRNKNIFLFMYDYLQYKENYLPFVKFFKENIKDFLTTKISFMFYAYLISAYIPTDITLNISKKENRILLSLKKLFLIYRKVFQKYPYYPFPISEFYGDFSSIYKEKNLELIIPFLYEKTQNTKVITLLIDNKNLEIMKFLLSLVYLNQYINLFPKKYEPLIVLNATDFHKNNVIKKIAFDILYTKKTTCKVKGILSILLHNSDEIIFANDDKCLKDETYKYSMLLMKKGNENGNPLEKCIYYYFHPKITSKNLLYWDCSIYGAIYKNYNNKLFLNLISYYQKRKDKTFLWWISKYSHHFKYEILTNFSNIFFSKKISTKDKINGLYFIKKYLLPHLDLASTEMMKGLLLKIIYYDTNIKIKLLSIQLLSNISPNLVDELIQLSYLTEGLTNIGKFIYLVSNYTNNDIANIYIKEYKEAISNKYKLSLIKAIKQIKHKKLKENILLRIMVYEKNEKIKSIIINNILSLLAI